ncbi:hypothetical protein [Streptomyces nigra]|uniref:Uncharacterized protein n=1 Tax=Streptomyces nigra TaxID=1827580 RepID=A0ABZ1IT91_9ACTN
MYEAEQRGLSAELAVYEREDSPVLDALIFADMTTGRAGQSFDFDTRIDEILVRYEPGSEVPDVEQRGAHPGRRRSGLPEPGEYRRRPRNGPRGKLTPDLHHNQNSHN